MKFTLVCQYPVYDEFTARNISQYGDKLTSEFDAVELDVILENFTMFLRGCGFHPDGYLTFVPHNE